MENKEYLDSFRSCLKQLNPLVKGIFIGVLIVFFAVLIGVVSYFLGWHIGRTKAIKDANLKKSCAPLYETHLISNSDLL